MAREPFKGRSQKRGLPPGTPVYIGRKKPGPARITVIDYSEASFLEKPVEKVQDCFPFKDSPTVTWINVDGIHDVAAVQALGERFGLHPLVQEDILNTTQRPKVEDYDGYLYLVVKMIQWDAAAGGAAIEQVSLILGTNFVISFQEQPGDVFDPIRDRIRTAKGRIRKMGADFLAYSLIDAIVDGYFTVLEELGDKLETLEEELVRRPTPKTLHQIHRLKREALFVRKSVWPLREVVSALQRGESRLIGPDIGVYLRDVYDHTIQAIDTMETFRDMLAGMLDTYLSSVSNRLNEVMKVLTIIATIFMPLTFLAGVYGMNFSPDASPWNMPELRWRLGYPMVLAVMLVIAIGMLWYFRRKKWI